MHAIFGVLLLIATLHSVLVGSYHLNASPMQCAGGILAVLCLVLAGIAFVSAKKRRAVLFTVYMVVNVSILRLLYSELLIISRSSP